MAKAIARALKRAWAMMKKMGSATYRALFGGGNGGGAVAMETPDEADEPEQDDDTAGMDAEQLREKNALDRKAKGLEPQDIKSFALGQTYEERQKLGQNLTSKTLTWANELDGPQRSILATAHEKAIERHMAGERHIQGLPKAPLMFGNHRPDTARQMINDLKNDGQPTDLVFGAKELDRVATNAAGKTFGKRPMPTPSGDFKRGTSATFTYQPKLPTPPPSMFASAQGA
ncbi:hypothetical protein G8E10_24765 [Rhizobiaceae bacterium CRRU44]|uniref:Uncharacterized protein n=1 Tax=Ferranicluibacter rubi TaxID=2715133 RepID=A0AA43ZKX5_9HYPH|nr:hypothetical protein [Ferranicluibacter rubi]NHT78915.1 hypothetical protein [Ferranicluibacter rubi]